MLNNVDQRLQQNNNGLFDEDAHNVKRQMLLQRAAEAKRRIDAMNAQQQNADGLAKKTSFEMLEERKCFLPINSKN